jgi:hypothetical protein
VAIDFRRKSDIKLVAGATVAVILVGLFIAGAMIVTTRGTDGAQCGQLNIGLASGVRTNLDNGPYFQTGGGDCGFWLALDNGDITAYRAVQPATGCTLLWKGDHWECDGSATPVSELAQYPVTIQTQEGVDVVVVNLGTPQPSGATPTT